MSVPPLSMTSRPCGEMPHSPVVFSDAASAAAAGPAPDIAHMNVYPETEKARGKKGDDADRVRSTWARNGVSTADRVAKPASVHELQIAVLNAVKNGEVPCVVRGAMHSWSPVALQTRGTALDLSRLKTDPVVDRVSGRVTVPGGMLLEDLYKILDENGLALTAVPTVTTATAAGAFATEHEYASMIWFPNQERVMMRAGERTTEPRKPRGFFQRVVVNDFIRGTLASLLMRFIAGVPKLAKAANFVAARAFPKKTVYRDNWHEIQTYLPGHANEKAGLRLMEYGIKLEHAGKDLQIEFMWPEGFRGAVEKSREMEARFLAEFGAEATPHEGKLFHQNSWNRYPQAERENFLALRSELDPGEIFSNPYAKGFLNGEELE